MAVYARFGISLPHYDAWIRQRGRAVNGLANAQPGDVICYDGHVAIYMGGGRIVHAADYKYGICIWNNAAFRRILSIRRFF
jgi:cell wall-associated NlpC family hydrolase